APQLLRGDVGQYGEVAEGEDELALVGAGGVQEQRPGLPALATLVLEVVLVVAGLADGALLPLLDPPVSDPDLLEVPAAEPTGVPALDLDDDGPQGGGEDHEVGVAVADDGLVVDEVIFGELLEDLEQPLLPRAAPAGKPVWDHLGHNAHSPVQLGGRHPLG